MEEGLVVAIEFTAFDVESHSTCDYDHLTIQDGDGTTLMEKRCGSSLPANTIVSTSNRVELHFKTDTGVTYSGWSVTWSAVPVIQGECQNTFESRDSLFFNEAAFVPKKNAVILTPFRLLLVARDICIYKDYCRLTSSLFSRDCRHWRSEMWEGENSNSKVREDCNVRF